MDNNDSNKSQQTGGLKLMTVFIAVLALHVVVIGGFTVYHLMSGGSTDADVVSIDKSHGAKTADGTSMPTTPDANQPDKSAPTTASTAPSTDVATVPATTPALTPTPAPDTTTASETVPPSTGPAPEIQPVPGPASTTPPAPLTLDASTGLASNGTPAPLGPIPSDVVQAPAPVQLAPQMTPAPEPPVTALSSSVSSGPVHMPPAAKAPSPSHIDGQVYTVKITDSYKKIAKTHNITVAQLKEANHIKGDVLHTGQKLIIPPASKTMIAKAESTSLDSAPSAEVPKQSPTIQTAVLTTTTTSEEIGTGHSHLYTIVKGDTVSKIAHRFKTTSAAIMAENNITDPTRLTIGKKLRIPSRESRSAGNSIPMRTQPAPQPSPVQPTQTQTENTPPSNDLATQSQTDNSQPAQTQQPQGDLATFTP